MSEYVLNYIGDDGDSYFTGKLSPFGHVWSGKIEDAQMMEGEDLLTTIEDLLEDNFYPLQIEVAK